MTHTHTKLFQRRHSKLVIVVVADFCDAFHHDLGCDGLHGYFHSVHVVDETLETLVCKRRLSAVQLYDPLLGRERVSKGVSTNLTHSGTV